MRATTPCSRTATSTTGRAPRGDTRATFCRPTCRSPFAVPRGASSSRSTGRPPPARAADMRLKWNEDGTAALTVTLPAELVRHLVGYRETLERRREDIHPA